MWNNERVITVQFIGLLVLEFLVEYVLSADRSFCVQVNICTFNRKEVYHSTLAVSKREDVFP